MSEKWNIAILGATGAVGGALLEILAERRFPVRDIFALARTKSAGTHLRFLSESISVQDASRFDWTKAQLAFFAASKEATQTYIYEATNAGCLVIDLSGLFSLEPYVPLVMPDLNSFVISNYHNIIAVPNSLTSQLLTALKPFINKSKLLRIGVTSLLSTSAYGKKAIEDLVRQSVNLLNGVPINKDDFFGRQLAFNILPVLPDQKSNIYTGYHIVNEVRKILQNDKLMISAVCVQSPVFYGHAQIVNFEATKHFTAEEARNAFISSKEINLREKNEFPTQVDNAINKACLFIGCVRNDYGIPEQIQFWSVADNIRFGGAMIAIKIAEEIIKNHIY